MAHDLISVLKEDRIKEDAQRTLYGTKFRDYDLVWHVAGGGPLNHRNVTRQFKSLLRQAGLPEAVRFHDLRHTCATLLLEAGVNPKQVQEFLGHEDIQTTLGTYTHALATLQKETATAMQKLLDKGKKSS
jgi:integrase